MHKVTYLSVVAMVGVVIFCSQTQAISKEAFVLEQEATRIIDEYIAKYKPLDLELRRAWYLFNTTGDKKASDRCAEMELAIRRLSSDKERFEKIRRIYKGRDKIKDILIKRQIDWLYREHIPNQVSENQLEELTKLGQKIEETFNDYRPEVDGRKLTPVEVTHILTDSKDSKQLEKVWKAHHTLGAVLEDDYRKLVKLRNEIARDLGYKSAIDLSAEVNEIDLSVLNKFYHDIHRITQKPFKHLKRHYIDPRLAMRYGISVEELRPWHYQNPFFQEAPTAIFEPVDLDNFYKKIDSPKAVGLVDDFYSSLGIDVRGIIKNSSLYPKPGKSPHAVANFLDPDRPGSSVLIMNLPEAPHPPKASEVSTLVHELAHDINYEAIINNSGLPYILRDPTMLTEAVAMLFEKQTLTADWFERLGVPADEAKKVQEIIELIDYVDQMVFLRWASVIYCFEMAFYADPDQDIGDLWWKCKEECQLLRRPPGWRNPDAVAKYHIPIIGPLYYTSYAIGRVANVSFAELLASRVGQEPIDASYFGRKELGDWLMKDFLAQGLKYRWDDFIRRYTGEPFSIRPWKKYYIDSNISRRLFSG